MSKAKEDYYRYEKMLLDKYHVEQTAAGKYIRELEKQNKVLKESNLNLVREKIELLRIIESKKD